MIAKEQALIREVEKGVNGSTFNFSYKSRDNDEMVRDLGETLLHVCKVTPGGVLLFFPSYGLMNKITDQWREMSLWDELNDTKTFFLEPRESFKYKTTIKRYFNAVEKDGGAILAGVCRGKISEGLDFSDEAARAVIVVGIPFPQVYDPKTILK